MDRNSVDNQVFVKANYSVDHLVLKNVFQIVRVCSVFSLKLKDQYDEKKFGKFMYKVNKGIKVQ